jgi:hypothetical protein
LGEILTLIEEYEGVLQRHESMAANLGAKLVGPLLLKSFEKLFEGPIKIVQATYAQEGTVINWLDVVEFAHSKPQEFVLTDSRDGNKVCQFWIKQCKVEISEDDWRLVISGAPERMIPTQPIAEDETAELGTMDILEQKLAFLIKKADAVAGRARQLNYHLKGRKTAIQTRRAAAMATAALPEPAGYHHGETSAAPRPPSHGAYPPSPQPSNFTTTHRPSNGDAAAYSSPSPNLHQDLLRQFMTSPASDDRRQNRYHPARARPSRSGSSADIHHAGHLHPSANGRSSQGASGREESSSTPGGGNNTANDGPYKAIMVSKVEKLNKGDLIWPPCDRCRRLRMECTKHLTACAGCTKKHAKCNWRDVESGEAMYFTPENQVPHAIGEVSVQGASMDHVLSPGVEANVEEHQNLDPGLRNVGASLISGDGQEKRDDGRSEAEMLSHMAAAAAVGDQ